MTFQEGDFVLIQNSFQQIHGKKGIVVRMDGGMGKDLAGSRERNIFVWCTTGAYDWYSSKELIKLERLNRFEQKALVAHMGKYLEEDNVKKLDNLIYVILYARYRELQRELETHSL